MWNSDQELFELIKTNLYTPVVGDILDSIDCYHQFLPREVQPITPGMIVVGRAMPVLTCDVYGEQDKPFGLLTEALDQIEAGEVWVSGGSMSSALWGEILTATARTRGGLGAVVHGPHRDTPKVLEQNWPVFSTGRFAQDSRVRTSVQNFRITIEIEGTVVSPGDIIFGDLDGVVVVPKKHEKQVIEAALDKASKENLVRQEIEAGMSSSEAFKRYGVL